MYATLLDEGRYLCGESTMYRILRERGEVRERRRQATHPPRVKPELVATAPSRCWSWDITTLRGPAKWTSYHLYVVLDIYSRYVPGWLIADRESAALAERLLAETITKHQIARDRLTLHADRGTSMASKPVAMLPADLGVTKSHSRPRCSNDNKFSEAGFKTLKHRPDFPERFGPPLDPGRPSVLPDLRPLVQPRPPAFRGGVAQPRGRALRPRRRGARRASRGPDRRLRRASRAIRPQAPRTAHAPPEAV